MLTQAACQRSPKSKRVSAFASSTLIIRGYGLVSVGWGVWMCVCPRMFGGKAAVSLCPRGTGCISLCVFPGGLCVYLSPLPPRTCVRVALPRRLGVCASQVFMNLSFPGCLRVSRVFARVPCVFQMSGRLSMCPRMFGCASLSSGCLGVGTRLFSCVSQ